MTDPRPPKTRHEPVEHPTPRTRCKHCRALVAPWKPEQGGWPRSYCDRECRRQHKAGLPAHAQRLPSGIPRGGARKLP